LKFKKIVVDIKKINAKNATYNGTFDNLVALIIDLQRLFYYNPFFMRKKMNIDF